MNMYLRENPFFIQSIRFVAESISIVMYWVVRFLVEKESYENLLEDFRAS